MTLRGVDGVDDGERSKRDVDCGDKNKQEIAA